MLLKYERKPRGLTFAELLHLYSCCSPDTNGLVKSREYVGTTPQEALEGKKKTGLDTKYQVAFNLYDFDGDGMLGREDLRKTLCCVISWPYDPGVHDKGRLAGWPMPFGDEAESKLERFEVEERETLDQLTGQCLEDKLIEEIFEETGAVDNTVTYNQFKKMASLFPSFSSHLSMQPSAPLDWNEVLYDVEKHDGGKNDEKVKEWFDWTWDGATTNKMDGKLDDDEKKRTHGDRDNALVKLDENENIVEHDAAQLQRLRAQSISTTEPEPEAEPAPEP